MQLGLSETGSERGRRAMRHQVLMAEMERVVPWSDLKELSYYPSFGRGRWPFLRPRMPKDR